MIHGANVVGKNVDSQTRCQHYHTKQDIIAIKFPCCDTYYPCHRCHEELADHEATVWPIEQFSEKAVLCGACGAELTIHTYLRHSTACPVCHTPFNPGCRSHHHLYFATTG